MDVVALAQLGVEYAVATLGTACTPEHVKKLMRLADQVVFSFDGDRAGRKAAWRALENSLALASDGKTLSFLFLPAEHDPDSYIREFGREAFEALIDNEALGLVAFLCRELAAQVDLSTEEGKAKFLFLAKPLVEQVRAPALGVLLRKKLAEMAGLNAAEVSQLLGGASPMAARQAPAPAPSAPQAAFKPRQPASGNGAWGGKSNDWKGKSRDGWRRDQGRDEGVPPPAGERQASDLGFELLQILLAAPKYALELPQNELPANELNASMRAILRVVDFVVEQPEVPATGHLLEALREDACAPLLASAFAKGRDIYREGDEAILAQTWQQALARYLLLMEKPKAARRQAELAAKGLSNLSADERAEYGRLVLLGR
jgi:DNA primase